MKKRNKNILLFVLVMLFLLGGLCSKELADHLIFSGKDFVFGILYGNDNVLATLVRNVDASSTMLRNHDALLDLNSAKEHLIGTRVVEKEETTIVKSDEGNLLGYLEKRPYSDEEIQSKAMAVANLKDIATRNGVQFLYCATPAPAAYDTLPPNVTAYNDVNNQKFLEALTRMDIPLLDSAEVFEEQGMTRDEIFFNTDHHWKPKAGFLVTEAICRELQQRYGFQYNAAHADLDNYQVTTLENWFLGSYGKKVGSYFTDWTVDDFDVILPAFPTEFTEEIPASDSVRTGSFEKTMLHSRLLEKDYYEINTYASYSGGDFRLQKITNHGNPEGKKILVIRQSYGCVVTPFLAIHAGQLHAIDDRPGDYPAGEILDLEAHIRTEQPDYVIVVK
jgi:hypothetical protein